ncbi:MAG: hypothetical protein H6780_04870 [Candidatus Nomurabacteria bacterium]|nr:MAG: hypothetical protein H6780_04870 [Candidatus Nomurabacteria bacterium]
MISGVSNNSVFSIGVMYFMVMSVISFGITLIAHHSSFPFGVTLLAGVVSFVSFIIGLLYALDRIQE